MCVWDLSLSYSLSLLSMRFIIHGRSLLVEWKKYILKGIELY